MEENLTPRGRKVQRNAKNRQVQREIELYRSAFWFRGMTLEQRKILITIMEGQVNRDTEIKTAIQNLDVELSKYSKKAKKESEESKDD